jgi:hypothetical protein
VSSGKRGIGIPEEKSTEFASESWILGRFFIHFLKKKYSKAQNNVHRNTGSKKQPGDRREE